MTKIEEISGNNITEISEKQIEEQKLQEIYLILSQMFKREEIAAKAIVGCLYDIATVNVVNRYVGIWGINQTLKYLARFPRPIVKTLAVKLYVQPRCPKLITDWFFTLVEFPIQTAQIIEGDRTHIEVEEEQKQIQVETLPVRLEQEEQKQRKIKSLQGQVRILTGTLVTTIVVFSGSILWVANNLQVNPLDLLTTTQAKTVDYEQ